MYLTIWNRNDGIVVIDEDGTLCVLDKDGDISECDFVETVYDKYDEINKPREERYKQYLELKKEFEQ